MVFFSILLMSSCREQQLFGPMSFAHLLAPRLDPLGHVPHVVLRPEGVNVIKVRYFQTVINLIWGL